MGPWARCARTVEEKHNVGQPWLRSGAASAEAPGQLTPVERFVDEYSSGWAVRALAETTVFCYERRARRLMPSASVTPRARRSCPRGSSGSVVNRCG